MSFVAIKVCLDQITRFSPVTLPPGTPADCVRAIRLVPTWTHALAIDSTLSVIHRFYLYVQSVIDHSNIVCFINIYIHEIKKYQNVHRGDGIESISIKVMRVSNRQNTVSIITSASISMLIILLLCERNFTHTSQEWGQNTLTLTSYDALTCSLQDPTFELWTCWL